MAIKKIEIRPKGTNNYRDVLYPKTSADQVETADGNTIEYKINIFDNFKDGINNRLGIKTKNITNHNLNDIKNTGFYSGRNLTHAPDTGRFLVEVIQMHQGIEGCLQRITKENHESVWERVLNNGEWKDWVEIPNKDELDKKISKADDAFTGIAKAYPNTSYTVSQIRNIIISSNDANVSSMNDGEIWIKIK